MSEYTSGGLVESRRARIRIQIRTEPGRRDEIIFAMSYSISTMADGRNVLSYVDKNLGMGHRVLFAGQYFETKLMG